jgi:CDP-glucose 4,6-dehydratase
MEKVVINMMPNSGFWKDKSVFITGHTGFKGGWLALWLSSLGAKVTGFSLDPVITPNFYTVTNINDVIFKSIIGDIRNFNFLKDCIVATNPEIVIHMAAQPLVRSSYLNPIETFSTNVMGTVNLLESVRYISNVRSIVIVTTDKCYENNESIWGYREHDRLGGRDPYSSSKACAEFVTSAFRHSFFSKFDYGSQEVGIASARAGNVIGGGDWSDDRLIPDAIKSFSMGSVLNIRNPLATRPWQHVIEPLSGYMLLAESLYNYGSKFNGGWNFGPKYEDTLPVNIVINKLIESWPVHASWRLDEKETPYESKALKLDITKSSELLGWKPRWSIDTALEKTIDWHNGYVNNSDMRDLSFKQIMSYVNSLER